ncbi:hypothetical protein SprV_0200703200 [Sparganum proliferum]
MQLPQHGVDAEDSCPLQYLGVGDPVLPHQFQYPSTTVEVEVIESSRLLLVYRPGLRSIQQRRQDDCLVHFLLRAEMETVTVPDGALQAAEGLAGFGNEAAALPSILVLRERVLTRYVKLSTT